MKIFLLEILSFTTTTAALMALPFASAKTLKRDKDALVHLEHVGTFGM